MHLQWQNKDLGGFDIHLQKKQQQWQGEISSQIATGKMSLPDSFDSDSKISMDMQYINLSALSEMQMQGGASTPDTFPVLDIKSNKLYWRSVNLGELDLQASPGKQSLTFDRIDITAEEWMLSARGSCRKEDEILVTETKGKFTAANLGNFLSQLNFTDEMKGTQADIDFSLQWDGAPYQFSLANVNGNVKFDTGEGRLLGIEPGLGRILGAFDLAQWKRRVRMDFSDIYAAGLAFNDIKGSFYLANGYADTNDLVIDAVAAKFEIKGQTGLITHLYDQEITVTPKSSAVIPFAGTIAGLMVKKLTGMHPDSLTRSYYSLKGSWDKPELKKLQRKKSKSKKLRR